MSSEANTSTEQSHAKGVNAHLERQKGLPKKRPNSDRLYEYAKARINLTSREEWEAMRSAKDSRAMEIDARFKGESNQRMRKVRLLKKYKANPKDTRILEELHDFGFDEKEYERQLLAKEKRKGINSVKNARINRVLNSLVDEIDDFNKYGNLPMDAYKPKSKLSTMKSPDSTDEADYIITLLDSIRNDFRRHPLDPHLVPKVERLNEWLLNTRHKYLHIVLPK